MPTTNFESKTWEAGLWTVYCTLIWPGPEGPARVARGTHWVEGPETMTDAELAAVLFSQYGG